MHSKLIDAFDGQTEIMALCCVQNYFETEDQHLTAVPTQCYM